ncbi:uncharacterized protein BX664DRAFT_355455 [Halteromyces radiatus]|uniref:uncharacterized protein n=1 Tax=Halteromyces radiatus TaxID=101107 RepID=UPI00221E5656|nr:uncharacterized protein BX664DRAFT_355455 [Halteromyces radiatus]KAI8100111.1 hypothetical protein BX664DRAFT_355455 [Halteromyces radiatus]
MTPDGVPDKSDYVEALKTVKLEEFKDIGKIPCARTSLLYGMGAAFGLGGIRFLIKRSVPTSANWAVASFCGVSVVNFELCQMDRKQKLERLRLIVKETDSSPNQRRQKEAIKKNLQVIVDEDDLTKQQQQQQQE